MASQKGLGKGLGALLGDFGDEPQEKSAYQMLPIYKVEPNPEQLAKSKPLLVRLVNAYIVRNILNDEGFFPLFERDDDVTKEAVKVLTQ